ncbi:MAG: hypothetical protein ACKVP0_15580 [Pirellulaceae bacterium]
MPFFACFQMQEDYQFRLDTRIYLRESDEPGTGDACIAAIIGKNPGSANPTRYGRLSLITLDGDKLLPFVRNRFLAAYEMADSQVPPGSYIRVWNLLYLCNPTLKDAIAAFATVREPLFCNSEGNVPPFVWFAWGPPNSKLTEFTARFMDRHIEHPFYYDMATEIVESCKPKKTSKVKHTQGLPAEPIEAYLSKLVG